ncbi:head GIN domain-containing protein [Saccharospirillum salsuginis]|uniref:Putative auto-transporter adhesin head GIN domain-containing protein n=1 Tax=Saccharospirillum salsuginis TaxID=418750 RepID=A0A918NIF3_9GAMM|nr:head GIN domain-containing protein [Saccharospirillum salsuginis]GGX72807.1 hypothetical protein GCM10007392_45170 [Saccharospirillum salsuginis]
MKTVKQASLILGTSIMMMAGCAFSATVAGQGDMLETRYELPALQRVEIGGIGEVNLIESDRRELVVHAQENVLESLVITIRGDELDIGPERGVNFSGRTEIIYDLYIPEVEHISLSVSLNLHSDGFATPDLTLDFSGSVDADMVHLDTRTLKLDAAGSADVDLSGNTERFIIETAGSADVNAEALRAQFVDIDTAGSASIRVWAEQRLTVDAAGSADVRYAGRPLVEQSAAGSAKVRPLN